MIIFKSSIILTATTVLLVSCATTTGQLRKDRLEMSALCKEEGYAKSTVPYAHCLNKKIEQQMIEINYPYFDLVDLAAAYRVYITEKLESGALSESESELLWADFKTKYASEEHKRTIDATYARAAAARGNAALIQSLGIVLEAQQPQQTNPSSITCVKQGVFTNCNL